MKRLNIDIEEMLKLYNDGYSIKKLAEYYNVARTVIYTRFKELNIVPRNKSQSMYNRMAHTSKEEKYLLTRNAVNSLRNKPRSINELKERAKSWERTKFKQGYGEQEVFDYLINKNYDAVLQKAFLGYNFDIGIGENIAIEICCSTSIPTHIKHNNKKVIDCLPYGKRFIFLWLKNNRQPITENMLKNIEKAIHQEDKIIVIKQDKIIVFQDTVK